MEPTIFLVKHTDADCSKVKFILQTHTNVSEASEF